MKAYTARVLDKNMELIEELRVGFGTIDTALQILGVMHDLGALDGDWIEIYENDKLVKPVNTELYFNRSA